jgi:hypothetical protein
MVNLDSVGGTQSAILPHRRAQAGRGGDVAMVFYKKN